MAVFTFEEIWDNFNINAGLGLFTEKAAIPGPFFDDSWVPGEDLTVTSVINTDQPFDIAVQWRQTGNLCNNLDDNHQWRIEILFEKMGKGEWELPFSYRVTHEPYVRSEPHNYSVYDPRTAARCSGWRLQNHRCPDPDRSRTLEKKSGSRIQRS